MKRIRILYVILAVLLLASVTPLLFYALKTMDINRQALETNEILMQNAITHSVAEEISIYNTAFHQLLDNLDRLLSVQAGVESGRETYQSPGLRTTLEELVASTQHIIYMTVLDAQGRGIQAGNYSADADPFLVRTLDRAFAAAQQRSDFQSDPVLISQTQNLFPAMLISRPIMQRPVSGHDGGGAQPAISGGAAAIQQQERAGGVCGGRRRPAGAHSEPPGPLSWTEHEPFSDRDPVLELEGQRQRRRDQRV